MTQIRPETFDIDQLYSDETTKAVLAGVDKHFLGLRSKRTELLETQRDAWAVIKEASGAETTDADVEKLVKTLSGAKITHPELPDPPLYVGPPTLPTTNSCVWILGPYSQWTNGALTGFAELAHVPLLPTADATAVATSTPLAVDARAVVGGGLGNFQWAATGVSAWVRTGSTGPADLSTQFVLNAHDYVFGGLGGGEGIIAVGALVSKLEFRLREGRHPEVFAELVPVGSALSKLGDLSYLGFERWDMEVASLSVPFDGEAGQLYSCAAWVFAEATAVGLSGASAEISAVNQLFRVCQ
jgi:hypothetical protein